MSEATPKKSVARKRPVTPRTDSGSKKAARAASPRKAVKRPSPAPKPAQSQAKPGVGARPPRALIQNAQQSAPLPGLPQPDPGQSVFVAIIAGTDSPTAALGVGAVDLCEIAPSGQVALGGDAFPGDTVGGPGWTPSVGLHVRPGTLDGVIQFDYAFGQHGNLYAETDHPVPGSQLPAGTIRVQGNDYALITRTRDQLIPVNSRLVQINPTGPGWPTVPGSLRDVSWQDGNQTQISGYETVDWVYIISGSFDRQRSLWLYRCPPAHFTDRNWWHAWGEVDGGPEWGWDVAPTPLSDDPFGEISLRPVGDKIVFAGFNARTLNVEVRVADDVTQVLAPDTPVINVATQADVPQCYGGYIVPGSTLDQTIILVSQWDTDTGNPYNVQQFVVNLNI